MAHYDKYDPIVGGFRAKLAAAPTLVNGGIMAGVSLNASGRVAIGTGGQTGLVGVVVKNVAKGPVGQWGTALNGGTPNPNAPIAALAGSVVDVMTSGEIVDLDPTVFVAGTIFYTHADGSIDATATAGTKIGWTVEAGRLIVRIGA